VTASAFIEPHESLRSFLEHMGRIAASDLYLTAGSPPVFRVDDVFYPGRVPLEADEMANIADSLMSEAQRDQFHATLELNLAFSLADESRFRVNLFWQRGVPGMAVRFLRTPIRTLAELGHPPLLQQLAGERRGLVLVVGGDGSGKSTTIAAMIDHRNSNQTGHILTIEEPIEFIHPYKQCIVMQREVGFDTRSYAAALRSAPRQAPDLIFIGEIRDAETLEAALNCSASGLCLSTLHASDATQAVTRALSFFPAERHAEISARLSQSLRAVLAQRLVVSVQGGRVAALEILLDTARIRELIRRGQTDAIAQALEHNHDEGCCNFDTALFRLLTAGRIGKAEALAAAGRGSDLLLRMQHLNEAGPKETSLRLAPDYESPAPPPAPVPAPPPERRSKVGPVR
jgi:twitching motility protein PilU